jgi:hypothetical protein
VALNRGAGPARLDVARALLDEAATLFLNGEADAARSS